MQTEGAIRQKLKQVRFRCQKKLIEAHLEPRPCNCLFNRTAEVGAEDHLALCVAAERGVEAAPFRLCDERIGGETQAKTCSWFEAARTKESVKAEFDVFMDTSTLGRIAELYPDMAALMWALSDGSEPPPPLDQEQTTLSVPPAPVSFLEDPKGFLRRLLSWDWSNE